MLYGSVLFLFFLAFLNGWLFYMLKLVMLQLRILIKDNLLNDMNLNGICLILFATSYFVLNFHENYSRLIKI